MHDTFNSIYHNIVVKMFSTFLKRTVHSQEIKHIAESVMPSLAGRDLLHSKEYTSTELKSLIWTALDLKNIVRKNCCKSLESLEGYSVTVLLLKPNVKHQIILESAAHFLGAKVTTVIDPEWERNNIFDTGKCVSTLSDITVAEAKDARSIQDLADASSKPVVDLGSRTNRDLQCLADVMTLFERFGRLGGLRVAWVGPVESLLCSLLVLLPKLGMHLSYTFPPCQDTAVFPGNRDFALRLARNNKTEIHEWQSSKDAVRHANAIFTTPHDHTELKLTRKMLEDAALDWVLLHDVPRGRDEILDGPDSLVWHSARNLTWIVMATFVRLLKDYVPLSCQPQFDQQ